MNYQKLRTEITTDPLSRGYSGMTDKQVADSLNAADIAIRVPVAVNDAIRWLAGTDGFSKLRGEAGRSVGRTAASGAADAALAILNNPHVAAIDTADPEISGMFDALVAAGLFTAEQRQALEARGDQQISRAEQLGLGRVSHGHIQNARAQ